jgi:hypothetical protein
MTLLKFKNHKEKKMETRVIKKLLFLSSLLSLFYLIFFGADDPAFSAWVVFICSTSFVLGWNFDKIGKGGFGEWVMEIIIFVYFFYLTRSWSHSITGKNLGWALFAVGIAYLFAESFGFFLARTIFVNGKNY